MNPLESSRPPPRLYIMTGLPYSGKTTLRKALVTRLHCEAVSVDEIMDASDMWRAGHPTQEDWNAAYTEAYRRIEDALRQGKTVIFDCANLPYCERANVRAIAEKLGIQSTVIYVNISKDEIIRRRLENAETQARGQLDDEMMERAFKLFEEPTEEEHPVVYRQQPNLDEWIATFLNGQQEMA
jgi:predicted kinase